MSEGTFWNKTTFYWSNFNFSFFFGTWAKTFWPAGKKKIFVRVIKTAVYLSVGFFWWETLVFWKTFFPIFRLWTRPSWPAGKKFSAELSNLRSTCSWEKFLEKYYFFMEGRIFFTFLGHWASFLFSFRKTIDGVVNAAFHVCRTTIWGKSYFLKKEYFLFRFWALRKKNFRLLAKKFSSSLSK